MLETKRMSLKTILFIFGKQIEFGKKEQLIHHIGSENLGRSLPLITEQRQLIKE